MNNVLFLHHFESMWEEGLKGFDTSMEDVGNKVMDFLSVNDIDTLLITRMESNQPEDEHSELLAFCHSKNIDVQFQEYAYAMYRDPDMHSEDEENEYTPYPMEKFGKTWTYGTREHHDNETDVLDIEEFHYDLKNANKVYLAGAFEGECVLDQETILDEIGAEYEKIDSLVVGTYVEYEYQYRPVVIKEIEEKIEEICEELTDYDYETLVNESPKELLKCIDLICDMIEEQEDELIFINYEVESNYDFVNEFLESAKYDEIENLKEEKTEEIELKIEIKDNTILLEKPFFQGAKFILNKDDTIEMSKTFNMENSQSMIYLSADESYEENESASLIYNETEIPIVFKVNVNANTYKADFNEIDKNESIEHFDEEFSFDDMHDACRVLSYEDYDALLTIEDGNENLILLDDDSPHYDSIEIKAKINNKWTEYVKPEELEKTVKEELSNKRKRKSSNRI